MKARNNLRYQKREVFSVYYELDKTPSGDYLAVPLNDVKELGFMVPGRSFLTNQAKRSFKGNVIYLSEKDMAEFLLIYKYRNGCLPEIKERCCNNISRLPKANEPLKEKQIPNYEEIAYSVDDHRSDCTDILYRNPYIQSVTDFLMYLLVCWIVKEHPVQGPKMLDTRLINLRTWIRKKVVRLQGKVYDDKTRLMWVYTKRTEFPTCPTCGHTFGELKNVHLSAKYPAYQPHCSSRCAALDSRVSEKMKKTSLQRYGTEHPSSSPQVSEKIARTIETRYGSKSILNRPSFRETIRSTCLRKFGSLTPLQNREIYEKTKETVKRRYGVDNVLCLPSIRNKAIRTMRSKYGVSNPLKSPEIREKMQATVMRHLGVRFPAQSPDVVDRIIATRIKNQRRENRPKMDGLTFDSHWELAFYQYCVSHGMNITYHPHSLSYVFEGTIHRYYPDFLVNGKLYEVKGDCFIQKDGTWKCPFRKKGTTDKDYDRACRQLEAKRKCLLDNGVTIVSGVELRHIDKLFEETK